MVMAKRGRPEKTEEEKRTRRFLLRFTPPAFAELERMAAQRGLSKAALIEWLLKQASHSDAGKVG